MKSALAAEISGSWSGLLKCGTGDGGHTKGTNVRNVEYLGEGKKTTNPF